MMMLDFINQNDWNRPIYFTGSNHRFFVGLSDYVQNEGFAYRLVPIKSNTDGRIDTDILYNNLMNVYSWGNMNNEKTLIDHTINRTTKVCRIRDNFAQLAKELCAKGDTVKAIKVLERCDSIMPMNIFVPNYSDVDFAKAWYAANQNEKGDYYLSNASDVALQELEYFCSLNNNQRDANSICILMSFQTLYEAYKTAAVAQRLEQANNLKVLMDRYSDIFAKYLYEQR